MDARTLPDIDGLSPLKIGGVFAQSVGQPYDPVNDPKIYNDPEKIKQLPPELQRLATINLAMTGKMGEASREEAELIKAGMGGNVTFDGQISAEEAAAYKKLEESRQDKFLMDAGKNTLEGFAAIELRNAMQPGGFQMGVGGTLGNLFSSATDPAINVVPRLSPTLDELSKPFGGSLSKAALDSDAPKSPEAQNGGVNSQLKNIMSTP